MKRRLVSLSLCLATITGPAAPAPPAEQDDARALTSRITEVTVYADRARVTRVVTVDLAAGMARYAFRKLPGWIDEGSVRVALTPAAGAELVDVQVLKTYLARPDDEAVQKAEVDVQEMADQMAAIEDERQVLDAQVKQIESIRVFSLEKLPKDAATREVKVEEYGGVVTYVSQALLETARAKRELERQQRELQPELQARQRRLTELRQRAQLEQRTVMLTISATAAPAATLSLTYMLPGATWEPVQELRATNGGKNVTLASYGIVTQTTGEDWDGASVALSTQRSTETIRIPELEALLVGGGRALGRVLAAGGDSFAKASAAYSEQTMLWNAYVNTPAQQGEFMRNWDQQRQVQARVIERFRAVQLQRGTTAHFAVRGIQTIRTDGRPVRAAIGAAQLEARPRLVAAPEISLNAVRVADLVNRGQQPLLPGRVQLFVDGAFLGTTEIDFVAPAEEFPVFLGVADQVKLARTLDRKRSALTWSGKRTRLQVCFLVTVENLSDQEVTLQLGDRVPVSETDEIRLTGVRLTPSVKPDSQGLVKWELTLAPNQKQECRLEYTLDYPTELPQSAAPAEGEGSAGEATDRTRLLRREILQIEKALH